MTLRSAADERDARRRGVTERVGDPEPARRGRCAARRRRSLVAYRALLVAGLGGLLGVGLGTFVAYSARAIAGSSDFVVPCWNLAAAGIGAPLVAALVAAAARGRLPLVRRAE